jgi:hypothetical protein
MPVVECPSCHRHYDPENEAALKTAGPRMSVKVPCPACGQWVRLPEWECVEAPGFPPAILKEMSSQSRLLPEDDPSPVVFGPATAKSKPKPRPWWRFW